MNRSKLLVMLTVCLAGTVLLASVTGAAVYNIRPCTLSSTALQDYFTSIGQTINTATDQNGTALWTSTISHNSTFTIMLELGGDVSRNAVGLYNEGTPSIRYEVFPDWAGPGWFAIASFDVAFDGHLMVNLFDEHAGWQGAKHYYDVNSEMFGFYIEVPAVLGPSQIFYSEDDENGYIPETTEYRPQNLVYAATGSSLGSWWLTFQNTPSDETHMTFSDVIIFLESVNVTPVEPTTWGAIKSLYAK